jgi:hypothetical protein
LKPFCFTIPSVMPVTAGTIAALASDCATCEAVTAQKFCETRMMADAATTQMPGITTHIRLLRLSSMKPPIGVVISIPATLPIVIAVPISPLAQPRSCRKTLTKGPMPDCMSAMKKLSASRGQMVDGKDRVAITTFSEVRIDRRKHQRLDNQRNLPWFRARTSAPERKPSPPTRHLCPTDHGRACTARVESHEPSSYGSWNTNRLEQTYRTLQPAIDLSRNWPIAICTRCNLPLTTRASSNGYASPRPKDRLSSLIERARGFQSARSASKSVSR